MRCKACDSVLEETEIIWKEEEQCHEELCSKCLKLIHKYEEEEDLTTIIDISVEETYDDYES